MQRRITSLLMAGLLMTAPSMVRAEPPMHPFDLGNRSFIAGHFMDAIAFYTQAVEMDPESRFADTAAFQIARCYKESGQWEQAELILRGMPTSFPGSPWCDDALLELARYHAAKTTMEQYTKAAELYEKLVADFPYGDQAETAMIELAECYLILGRFGDVEPLLDRLLRRSQSMSLTAQAHYLIGQLHSHPSNPDRNLYKAIRRYTRIIRDYPDFAEMPAVYYALGANYQALRKWDDALSHYKKVVMEYPGSIFAAIAQSSIADCYRDKRDYKKAVEAFTDLVSNYPIRPAKENDQQVEKLIEQLKQSAQTSKDSLRIKADRFENVMSNSKVTDYIGHVNIQLKDLTIEADRARIDLDRFLIYAAGAVSLRRAEGLKLVAESLHVNLRSFNALAEGKASVEKPDVETNEALNADAILCNLSSNSCELVAEDKLVQVRTEILAQ
ncbi:tetratricopeptide repeat protein [bacterium]|nr:tetratricopeptide repeat protein [candidate division CSSED10-310 bacterium]